MHKVIIPASTLKAIVRKTAHLIKANSVLSVLQGLKFEVDEEQFIVRASNMETSLSLSNNCDASGKFEMVMDHVDLSKLCKVLPDGPTEILFDQPTMSIAITCGKASWKFSVLPPDDFPQLPRADFQKAFVIGQEAVMAMQTARIFASDDALRPAMTGIFITIDGGNLMAVTTNSHALYCSAKIPVSYKETTEFVLPKTVTDTLGNLGTTEGIELLLEPTLAHACFKVGNDTIHIRLIDAKYPAYKSVVPQNESSFSCDVSELFLAVKMTDVGTDDVAHAMVFILNDNEVNISAVDASFGRSGNSSASLSAHDGDNISIGMNSKLLSLVLGCLTGDIKVEYKSPTTALIFREEGAEEFFLLMPLMIGV